jgi:hypothetical protein
VKNKHRRASLGDEMLRWALLPLLPVALVLNRSRDRLESASSERLIQRRQREFLSQNAH